MSMQRTVRLTAAGKRKLEEERQQLVSVKRHELSARIADATQHGNVSDNSEYEDLKEEYMHVEARIRDLDHTLEHAEVFEPPVGGGQVSLGSTVTIRDDEGVEETWTLVSPEEADTRYSTISTESPVGHALLGRAEGESTSVRTPGGAIVYTVVKVA